VNTYRTRGFEQRSDLEAFAEIVAQLEGCSVEGARGFIGSLQQQLGEGFEASLVFVDDLEEHTLGAVLLRPTPKGSFELFGGVPAHTERHAISDALLRASQVLGKARGVSTYATENYWNIAALEASGFKEVAKYQRLESTEIHLERIEWPTGFTLQSFAETSSLDDLVAGLKLFEDIWGHHHVDPEGVAENLASYDPHDIWILKDQESQVSGLCRGTLSNGTAWIDAPGVRTDLRGQGLHRALLMRTLETLKARGAVRFTLESWGETAANSADDLEFGFLLAEETPIVAWQKHSPAP
jgi:GNAT superfamily N-acetyltransferase